MKQLGRKHLQAEARMFTGGNEPLVALCVGPQLAFVMDCDEATELAAQLVAAVDQARDTRSADVRG